MIFYILLVICHVNGSDYRHKLLKYIGSVNEYEDPSFQVYSRNECILRCVHDVNCSIVLYCDVAGDKTCVVSPQNDSVNNMGLCGLFSTEEPSSFLPTCENGGTPLVTGNCDCPPYTTGVRCETRIRDCKDVFNFITSTPGNYAVYPLDAVGPFDVNCDDPINYGIVMMHRDIHSTDCTTLPVTYLDVGWDQYQQSFSEGNCYFWLGLEKIHALTSAKPYQLHIYVKDLSFLEDVASYSHFRIGDEASRYMMTAAGFSLGSILIGDGFHLADPTKSYNGTNFCTDGNCVSNPSCGQLGEGGWWYTDVCSANPNYHYGTTWLKGDGTTTVMMEMTMTLRPEI